jgi:formate dehydrogenase accessory protein FdhD
LEECANPAWDEVAAAAMLATEITPGAPLLAGARIPVDPAISAPSSLAIELAESSGQTLVGFLRGGQCNVYTHPERIRSA